MVLLYSWNVADWLQFVYICVTFLGVVVTGYSAIWVVKSLQKHLDKQKQMKNYACELIIKQKNKCQNLMTDILNDKLSAKDIRKQINRQSFLLNNDLDFIKEAIKIEKCSLGQYLINLLEIIEKETCYKDAFKNDEHVVCSSSMIDKISQYEIDHAKEFDKLLIQIIKHNDEDK